MSSSRRLGILTCCGLYLVLVCWGSTPGEATAAPAPLAGTYERGGSKVRMEQVPVKRVLVWLMERTRKPMVASGFYGCLSLPQGRLTFGEPTGASLTVLDVLPILRATLRE